MSRPPQPKLVRLEPPGPYITLVAEGFLGLAISPSQGSTQMLRFVLSDGLELHLPLSDTAYERLEDQLAGLRLARAEAEMSLAGAV